MDVRDATLNDVNELTFLMEQLGYPTTIENMETRFKNIALNPDYKTLVATSEGSVVGMIGLLKRYYYEMDGYYVRIVALVVNTRYRNKGIGKKLIEEAENWSSNLGATGIGLNSGNRPERFNAHKFYKNRGYIEKSIGFVKSLI